MFVDFKLHIADIIKFPLEFPCIILRNRLISFFLIECLGLVDKILVLTGQDFIFHCFHLVEFFIGNLQEVGQCQLLIDAVGSV